MHRPDADADARRPRQRPRRPVMILDRQAARRQVGTIVSRADAERDRQIAGP
jgi:hypothetical protein